MAINWTTKTTDLATALKNLVPSEGRTPQNDLALDQLASAIATWVEGVLDDADVTGDSHGESHTLSIE